MDTTLGRDRPQALGPSRAQGSVERRILDAVSSIRYGSVVIAIQDGRVVQIESTEKQRIGPQG
jgi:hypothetical protein